MKFVYVLPLLFLFSLNAFDLTVKISGIKPRGGIISLALYNNKKEWLDEIKVYMEASIEEFKDTAEYTFKNIPKGYYAIAILHDENRNNRMDKNIFLPKEGYGFTMPEQSGKGTIIPPNFEKASLYVDRETFTTIRIIYL